MPLRRHEIINITCDIIRLVTRNALRSLEMSGQTLTAPYCDRVIGIASVYPVSRGTRIDPGQSRLIVRGLVAGEATNNE